ncbi:MAG: hypothetical protein K0M69_00565 [Youngiibacter sp.]|nr:hypothetical protein [Youngiibacter sp.]
MSEPNQLFYKVISTGSKGNAVIVDRILFDCGVPFKDLKKDLYNVQYMILTHRHSDHLKMQTYTSIRKLFPHIRVMANYDVAYQVPVDIISNEGIEYSLGKYIITPFANTHDVPCQGYVVQFDDLNVIYSIDTSSLENAIKLPYDYMFLESYHDEKKINMIRGKSSKYGYDAWAGAMRHLSTQKCLGFYYTNRRNKESKLIELHQSERFY